MKRILGLVVGAFMALGLMQSSASALTLTAAPTDTDFTAGLHFGTPSISFPPFSFHINPVTFDDQVTLNLVSSTGYVSLAIDTVINLGISGLSYTLYSASDLVNPIVSYAQLAVGQYFLHITGSTTLGLYATKLTATAVTPIPPALLLFATALGGLGFAGYRRRKTAA